jgi:hypothetical protein
VSPRVSLWKASSRSRRRRLAALRPPSYTSRPSLIRITRDRHRFDFLQDVRAEQNRFGLAELSQRLADAADLVRGPDPRSVRPESSTSGSCSSAWAMPTRCLKPLESLLVGLCITVERSQISTTASIRSFLSGPSTCREHRRRNRASQRGHFGIERAVFGQITEPPAARDPVFHHVVTGDPGVPFAGGDVAGQHLHRGAFAGPVGTPRNATNSPSPTEKGHVAGGRERSIELAQTDRLDHRRDGEFSGGGLSRWRESKTLAGASGWYRAGVTRWRFG